MPYSRIFMAAAGVALVITIIAVGISIGNQSLRREAALRQQAINQGVVWSQINMRLANSLGVIAAREHDERIRKLLEEHGIAVHAGSGPTSGPAAPAPVPATK